MVHIDDLEYKTSSQYLIEELKKRIIVLDGAMGTMIQQHNLSEPDFRGTQYTSWSCNLKGCNDILCITVFTS